jgi:hypothetical protein
MKYWIVGIETYWLRYVNQRMAAQQSMVVNGAFFWVKKLDLQRPTVYCGTIPRRLPPKDGFLGVYRRKRRAKTEKSAHSVGQGCVDVTFVYVDEIYPL